jgi:anaerobic selenocysteine-containing dehydrogenase
MCLISRASTPMNQPTASIAPAAPGPTRSTPRRSSSARTAPRRCPGKPRQSEPRPSSLPHTVSELWNWHDHALENEGRLTHPMATTAPAIPICRFHGKTPCSASAPRPARLPDPNMAEFYTSGRASNEAAFLYQLFAREYGTNNFPDCSNMCHEATSVGLPSRSASARAR